MTAVAAPSMFPVCTARAASAVTRAAAIWDVKNTEIHISMLQKYGQREREIYI